MRFFILIAIVFIQLLPVHADAETVTDRVRDFTDAGGYDDAILREARRADGYRETGDFIPLVGIPFIDESGVRSGGLAAYANSLYRVAITIAAILAVIKIVIAGVQYMLTDVVTQKSQARKSIRTALLGLLLVVGAVLILNTVNPSLTNLEVLNLQQLSGELGDIEVDALKSGKDILKEKFPHGYEIQDCAFFRLSLTCESWCEKKDGIYIDKGLEFDFYNPSIKNTGTHQCVVATKDAMTEEESLLLNEYELDISDGEIFYGTPFESKTVIDDRGENPALFEIPDEDFLGFVNINWYEDSSKNKLKDLGYPTDSTGIEMFEYEILQEECGASNRLIKDARPGESTQYYCIKG